ncbi:unnamed protein product [Rotaria magnacalcarata]|uniref:NAD(P)(+)--arginine ADP-ribosyltransferase n=3 Tax=Rotaria magnacalcarata TaxID=392030 RepID=A0A817A5T4_9BILA|nr:unnamed protein product [Rotaria magnacalcarata]CAF2231505.1 unnamed protein product [Rotaria magnacalcarata]
MTLPSYYSVSNTCDKNFDIFSLIWLDGNTNAKEVRDTEQKLRSIINQVQKFADIEPCQKYIKERSTKERLIIIVSGRLGREIVPSIHNLRQVISIYVYCLDKEGNEKWSSQYKKVKAVVVKLDELLCRIKDDHKIEEIVEQPLSINIFTTSTGVGTSTTGFNGQFVFFQVLIDCLLRVKYTEADRKELIHRCKQQYEGNTVEINNIREFEMDYSPVKALWWYTRETFFYKMINAVLRNQDIHLMFLFRGCIYDILHQLEAKQANMPLKVYRSQTISNDELETLKQCCDQFISVNSFFSTSTNYQQAISFINFSYGVDNLQKVLFEIDADPRMSSTKPFADISSCSEYGDDSEVLFMLGSIFRLNDINRSRDDEYWIISMNFCSDEEHELKYVLVDIKEQFMSEETNLRTLGTVLWKMGKLDLAEKYFVRMLEEIPSDDPLVMDLYQDLGQLTSQMGCYDQSIQWHQKSLILKNQNKLTSITNPNEASISIGRRRRDQRFEGDSPGIEWVLAGSNADYLAQSVREFFESYGKNDDFEKLVSDVRRNYIEKELATQSEIDDISYFFLRAVKKKHPKYLLQAYTAETEFYRLLNVNLAQARLIETESVKLEVNQYCACIVGIISHHPRLDKLNYSGECYRGMSIRKNELEKYKKGSRILTKSFLSSSQNRDVAVKFADEAGSSGAINIICIYDVRNHRSALKLEEISEYPEEKEVLIMPYTAFKIMHVTYLDGKHVKIGAEIKLKQCEPW